MGTCICIQEAATISARMLQPQTLKLRPGACTCTRSPYRFRLKVPSSLRFVHVCAGLPGHLMMARPAGLGEWHAFNTCTLPKRKHDQCQVAIQDNDKDIRLDPQQAHSFTNRGCQNGSLASTRQPSRTMTRPSRWTRSMHMPSITAAFPSRSLAGTRRPSRTMTRPSSWTRRFRLRLRTEAGQKGSLASTKKRFGTATRPSGWTRRMRLPFYNRGLSKWKLGLYQA